MLKIVRVSVALVLLGSAVAVAAWVLGQVFGFNLDVLNGYVDLMTKIEEWLSRGQIVADANEHRRNVAMATNIVVLLTVLALIVGYEVMRPIVDLIITFVRWILDAPDRKPSLRWGPPTARTFIYPLVTLFISLAAVRYGLGS